MSLRLSGLFALTAISVAPLVASAQVEVPGSTGLGRPLAPLDARARALGGAAAALHGANLSAINPAALSQLAGAGFWATISPERRSIEGPNVRGELQSSDLPLARAAGRLSNRLAISFAFGGFLDQDFGVEFVDTVELLNGPVAFEEVRTANGGIAQFRLDMAATLSRSWSVGLAGIIYSGEDRRNVNRIFAPEANLLPYSSSASIDYLGWGFALGAQVQPIPELILGAAGSWGPNLTAKNDTTGEKLDLDLPLMIDVGGSVQLTPGLLFVLSFGWAGWAALADGLPETGGADAWRVGAGIESRLFGGASGLVFRAGGHWERFPFEIAGDAPSERALSAGLGALLREGRGRMDATIEFGRRGNVDKNLVEENYTRFTLSLAIITQR